MPFEQFKVDVPSTTRGNGSSDTESLQTAHPGSPIYRNEINDALLEEQANSVLIGPLDASDPIDSGRGTDVQAIAYWDLPTNYGRDYELAPNLDEVVVGGGGLPGSPYAPNIAVPAEGQNPADIPAEGVGVTQAAQGGGGPFGGDGLASPSDTRENVGRQTIGSLGLGTSTPSGGGA